MTATTSAVDRRTCAYWYAVGWSDATGDDDLAQEFADFHGAEVDRYYAEDVTFLSSVPDAWQRFQEVRAK